MSHSQLTHITITLRKKKKNSFDLFSQTSSRLSCCDNAAFVTEEQKGFYCWIHHFPVTFFQLLFFRRISGSYEKKHVSTKMLPPPPPVSPALSVPFSFLQRPVSLPLFPSLLLSSTPDYVKQRYRLKFPKGFLWSTVPEGKGDLTGTGWNKWQADSACQPSASQMDTDQGIKRNMETYSTTTVVQQCGIWESRHHDCCRPQNT